MTPATDAAQTAAPGDIAHPTAPGDIAHPTAPGDIAHPTAPGDTASTDHIEAHLVIGRMADHGRQRIEELSPAKTLLLGLMAGGFITAGAMFSVLLSVGFVAPGAVRLVEVRDSRPGSSSSSSRRRHCSPRPTW